MSDKKFKGKILGEPWEALAKGPREALATIWNDYLAEVLQVSPKSGRYQILRRQIETAAGFKEVFENWNTLNSRVPGRRLAPPDDRQPQLSPGARRQLRALRRMLRDREPYPARLRPRAVSTGSPDLERRLYPQTRREGDQPGGRGDAP